MIKLINKGGFRERANRSQRYGQSENQLTTLEQRRYDPESSALQSPLQSNIAQVIVTQNEAAQPTAAIQSRLETTAESTATTTVQQTAKR